jgi:PKHD-type hydroxylase
MMLQIPDVLSKAEVAALRGLIDAGTWIDGNKTSGFQAALAKSNLQLDHASPEGLDAGRRITAALQSNLLFLSAALPQTILPPLFNRYGPGNLFRDHVDNAVRRDPVTGANVRTDLSATLFLAEPDTYDGGELIVEDNYGAHQVKLAAGDMVLYPASSLHRVTPITRGERVASFFWIQSLVRRDDQRTLLFDMDLAIQRLAGTVGQDDPSIVSMTGAYHNLLRMWGEV